MHNLSRPEQEEGVSQLGLTGPEMEIARRNFIRPRTFSRTNRTLHCHLVFHTIFVVQGGR